jgi:hypothetical protein
MREQLAAAAPTAIYIYHAPQKGQQKKPWAFLLTFLGRGHDMTAAAASMAAAPPTASSTDYLLFCPHSFSLPMSKQHRNAHQIQQVLVVLNSGAGPNATSSDHQMRPPGAAVLDGSDHQRQAPAELRLYKTKQRLFI